MPQQDSAWNFNEEYAHKYMVINLVEWTPFDFFYMPGLTAGIKMNNNNNNAVICNCNLLSRWIENYLNTFQLFHFKIFFKY